MPCYNFNAILFNLFQSFHRNPLKGFQENNSCLTHQSVRPNSLPNSLPEFVLSDEDVGSGLDGGGGIDMVVGNVPHSRSMRTCVQEF